MTERISTEQLLTAARSGDDQSRRQLFARFAELIHNAGQADDATAVVSPRVQRALAEAAESFGDFQGNSEAELRAWLLSRAEQIPGSAEETLRGDPEATLVRSWDQDKTVGEKTVGEKTVSEKTPGGADQLDALSETLELLTSDQRRVVELRYCGNRSIMDIAADVKRSPVEVVALLREAMDAMHRD